jgi:hypothetical protein
MATTVTFATDLATAASTNSAAKTSLAASPTIDPAKQTVIATVAAALQSVHSITSTNQI